MNILITGASSGIGQQLAIDYLTLGNRVFICGRNAAALAEIADEYPGLANPRVFDIDSRSQCQEQLSSTELLDLVILNAGTCEYIDARHFDAELFERVVTTNLIGLGNCLAAVIPRIKRGGHLALMGSSSSYVPLPRAEAYGASKAATEYLAHTLGITLANMAISTSYIAPGFVKTPLTDRNDFPMPMRIDTTTASKAIRAGLKKRKSEIHFPRRFTWLLKSIGLLPVRLQQLLIKKITA